MSKFCGWTQLFGAEIGFSILLPWSGKTAGGQYPSFHLQSGFYGTPCSAGITSGMAFGVFIHRSDSNYEDTPAERYQFPRQYLGRAQATVGDWIVYYEPRKVVGTRGYFAVAKVERIVPDTSAPDMYLALIEPGTYLDFANPVPFTDDAGMVLELGVLNEAGRISGRAQSAVRGLSPVDFASIIKVGLAEHDALLPRIEEDQSAKALREDRTSFVFDEMRERVAVLVSRAVRDRVFRRVVLRAYDERCAVTGLKLINGGGRAEVEAAHIRPVGSNGPDIVSNGLALSGTAHWMFDRGLIGIDDDMTILVSLQVNDPPSIHALTNRSGRILLPPREIDRPRRSLCAGTRNIASNTELSAAAGLLAPVRQRLDYRRKPRHPLSALSGHAIPSGAPEVSMRTYFLDTRWIHSPGVDISQNPESRSFPS